MAEANAATLCGCVVCKEATTNIRWQPRLQGVRAVDAVVGQQVGQQAAATGGAKAAKVAELWAVGDPQWARKQKGDRRK